MAKLTDKDELNLIADWKTGRYSQRDLADKYVCSKGKVSQLTQGIEKSKNGQLVDAQVSLLSAKAHLSDEEMTAIMTTAQNEVFNNGLISNATQLNLVQMTKHLSENKKLEKVSVGNGVQNLEEVGLGSNDYLNIQNAIDKAAITLRVADRHAPKTEINNTNANQVNTDIKRVVIARRSDRND